MGRDRQSRAIDARLTLDDCEEVYWANFYARTEYTSGSTFFDFVDAREDTPGSVIDIGCGDGRDAFAFGVAGRRVLGLDRSHIGGAGTRPRRRGRWASATVRFQGCDVGDDASVRAALTGEVANSPGSPVLFYARFFLHSITEETQEILMAAIRDVARPGDMFAAEFRTDKDEPNAKVHTKHFRRFQNGPAFGVRLVHDYGFDVLFEQEGTGPSPYKGEDPELYRVLARKRAAPVSEAAENVNARRKALLADPRVKAAVRRARRQAGRAARKLGVYDTLAKGRRAAGAAYVPGMVEVATKAEIIGWVSVQSSDAPPTRISLHLNGLEVGVTWATDVVSLNSWGEVRSFRFKTRDLWSYALTKHKVVVRAAGHALPVKDQGMFLRPAADGKEPFDVLAGKLAEGYLFSSSGRLQLSKSLDTAWQGTMLGLYDRVRAAVTEAHGYESFVIYGSLLGAVREGGFIGHDFDFDAAYVSRHSDPDAVAEDARQVAFSLVDRGIDVECHGSALHIHDVEQPSARIDLFHLYFDDDGVLQFPFGAAGSTVVRKEDWRGLGTLPFAGRDVPAPVNAVQVVEAIYGPGWRAPQPGFSWDRDRKIRAPGGVMGPEVAEEVYWANFYAKTEYTSGSTFFDFVNAREDTPAAVIDIGCGDGRDAFAFGVAGRRVLGLDRSHIGVRHAAEKASSMGFADRVRFQGCDVGEESALWGVLNAEVSALAGQPVLFYARFFLHSIPEDVQDVLMGVVRDLARPGDMFAAEFRTDKDEANKKVHTKHYRRFQNGPAFGARLAADYGFEVLFELESAGLSPYKGEDPELYRVVGRRPDAVAAEAPLAAVRSSRPRRGGAVG